MTASIGQGSGSSQLFTRVAIVGRPNVGKSTLFNILTETRKALVKDQPGVTRDILIEEAELWGRTFQLVDTGGITEAADLISSLIREQVIEFLNEVDLLLVVMDGRAGLMTEDREMVRIASESGKPYLIIVNKLDREHEVDMHTAEFHEFSQEVVGVSFEQRRGLSQVLEWLYDRLPEENLQMEPGIRIAFLGKPNAGKSSLINSLLGENRMIVSPIAGTTTDAVETPFLFDNKKMILVDTAGLRRQGRQDEELEVISSFKSRESLRRSDIVLLVIDCLIGPVEQDARIMQLILENHKGVILVANKIDLAEEKNPEYKKWFRDKVERVFHFFTDVPLVFTSAETGHGVRALLQEVLKVSDKLDFRIPTSALNDFFFETIRKAPAPVHGNNNVKFYYLTQTFQKPPAFIAFANSPQGVDPSYRRFLVKQMKEKFDLWGIPLRIFVMKSRSD